MKKLMSIGLLLGASYHIDSFCMHNASVGQKGQEHINSQHINLQIKNSLASFGVQEQIETMEWFSLRMIKQERDLTEQEEGRLAVLIQREVRRQAKDKDKFSVLDEMD